MLLWKAIFVSRGIAYFEYYRMEQAIRLVYANGFSGSRLKMAQKVITMVVFSVFAVLYSKKPVMGNTW